MKKQIMDEAALKRAVMRISHEIIEKNKGTDGIVLVGIKRRGIYLSQMIRDNILKIENAEVPCESLDIHFYRDDLTKEADSPVYKEQNEKIDVTGRKIIIVDDVLYTGRTVRAAIEAIFSMGRPSKIQLAILIDRGHRELPFRADYIGKSIPTSRDETVSVKIECLDGETAVDLIKD
ncbi:MAG: bifunctional pyr operon transcriptional regulator/uracil phosphoribosyltransferase PyrR [Clostridia bacterium]|nr:bifunctional pyr operon transcriptional regulator/uracil phosphoribosyltransferase PyrR [Clostridia bacterium]